MVQTTEQGRATHATASTAADGYRRHEYRSLTDLVRELRDETTDLVRSEVKLAKIEISEKVSRVGRNSIYTMIGGAIAQSALVLLMFAAAAGAYVALVEFADMSREMAGWVGPLAVGLLGAIIGYIFIHKGIHAISNESLVPEKTVDSLRQDRDWAERKVQ
ncbi:MAG TPA: phage holin family protein [Lacipirellula sp.]